MIEVIGIGLLMALGTVLRLWHNQMTGSIDRLIGYTEEEKCPDTIPDWMS